MQSSFENSSDVQQSCMYTSDPDHSVANSDPDNTPTEKFAKKNLA